MSEIIYEADSLDLLLVNIIRAKNLFTNSGLLVVYTIFIGENNYFSATFVIT